MNNIESLKVLFEYAHAEVTNPTNVNAYFQSPLVWQAEVLVAVNTLAKALETDIDIEDFQKQFEKDRQHVSETYGSTNTAQQDLVEVESVLSA